MSGDEEEIKNTDDLASILGGLEPENPNAAKQVKDALDETNEEN